MKPFRAIDDRLPERPLKRSGAATVDYMLAIGVVLPLLAIVYPSAQRMMELIFELSCTLVAWPFM